jgi:hypothetical protein
MASQKTGLHAAKPVHHGGLGSYYFGNNMDFHCAANLERCSLGEGRSRQDSVSLRKDVEDGANLDLCKAEGSEIRKRWIQSGRCTDRETERMSEAEPNGTMIGPSASSARELRGALWRDSKCE